MRILTVIPILRGTGKDTLTYFSKDDAPIGSIVSIPVRKKTAHGLVVDSAEATEVKSELKTLSYSIRKTGSKSHTFLSHDFIKATQEIADYNATSVGATLFSLIPKTILEESSTVAYTPQKKPDGVFYETALLQTDDLERYATYRSLIREEFAKGRSIFFCLPTIEDLLAIKPLLEKGIEKYAYILHGGLTKKNLLSVWKEILSNPHPVFILATGSFLSLPRDDIGTIILEKESSRAYKMQTRPFLDIRTVAEKLAQVSGKRLVFGDTLLRVETLWSEKNNTSYIELSPLKFRSLSPTSSDIVDMRGPKDMVKKEFKVLSYEVSTMLKEAKENNERTVLFCGRKGLYPLTVCSDCGTTVICNNCKAPVVLYSKEGIALQKKQSKTNLFVCHKCGERRDASELCRHCSGWRLSPLGIGTDRVFDEVSLLLPHSKIFLMDKDHVTTAKQAEKIRDNFYNTPGGILIGTEMALNYLKEKVANTAVVSLDSFFSIPDFRIQEKIFHTLLSLRALAEKRLVIQTRQIDAKVFEYAVRGNLVDFYRDEIEDRKIVGFAPFATHIKISIQGEKTAIKKKMEEIQKTLAPYEVSIFDAWNPGSSAKKMMHALISLPKELWVDPVLLSKLRSLPPYCLIKVDPDTLL